MPQSRLDHYQHGALVFDVTDGGPADGVPVVLLHGWPQSSACWDELAPRLHQAGFRTFAPDQRGYSPGASPAGRRAYRLPLIAADTIALIDAIDAGPVHLIGHDWGAAVGYAVAAAAPDRLRTLTTLAVPHPGAFVRSMTRSGQALRSWYMAAFQLPVLPELFIRRDPGRFIRALESTGQTHDRAARDAEFLVRTGITTTLNWYRAIPFVAPWRSAGPVTVPTLHVYAAGDTALTLAGAELNARFVTARYTLRVLPGVSHWIGEEVPDLVADLFRQHVASQPEPSAEPDPPAQPEA